MFHVVVARERAGLFEGDLASGERGVLGFEVDFVPDEDEVHVFVVRVAFGLFVPLQDVFESPPTGEQGLLGDVVHEEGASGVFVEAARDGLEVVGAAGVPNFKFDGQVFDDDGLRDELGTGGRRQRTAERRVNEPPEYAGLADIWLPLHTIVADHDVAEPVRVGHLSDLNLT